MEELLKTKHQLPRIAVAIQLLFIACLPAGAATNTVVFNLGDFTTQPVAFKQVRIAPAASSFPRVEGSQVVGRDPIFYFTLADGKFTNVMATGDYDVTFTNRFVPTTFRITLPSTNYAGILTAWELTSAGTNAPGNLSAYSQVAADARFVLRSFGSSTNQTLQNTNQMTNAVGWVWTATSTNGMGAWSNAPAGGGGGGGDVTTAQLNTASNLLATQRFNGDEYFTNRNAAQLAAAIALTNLANSKIADLDGNGTNTTFWGQTNRGGTYFPTLAGGGVLGLDGDLLDSSITTLDEIAHVSGATGNIQTNLNARAPTNAPTLHNPTIIGVVSSTNLYANSNALLQVAQEYADNAVDALDLELTAELANKVDELNGLLTNSHTRSVEGSANTTVALFNTNVLVVSNRTVGINTNGGTASLEVQGGLRVSHGITNSGGASFASGNTTVDANGNFTATAGGFAGRNVNIGYFSADTLGFQGAGGVVSWPSSALRQFGSKTNIFGSSASVPDGSAMASNLVLSAGTTYRTNGQTAVQVEAGLNNGDFWQGVMSNKLLTAWKSNNVVFWTNLVAPLQ